MAPELEYVYIKPLLYCHGYVLHLHAKQRIVSFAQWSRTWISCGSYGVYTVYMYVAITEYTRLLRGVRDNLPVIVMLTP